jgi:hypothetical protein
MLKTRAASKCGRLEAARIMSMPKPKPAPRRKRSENLDIQRMRRLYDAMQRCSRAARNVTTRAALGTQVPALLELRGGDVLVLSRMNSTIDLLTGTQPQKRLRPTRRSFASSSTLAVQLGVASGIALRAREERRRAVVAVFAEASDRDAWRPALQVASARKLPMMFFLLSRARAPERLLADANAAGVASMLVDAADSVAVYRVCQEAQLRARMGDGPAFIVGYLPRSSARPDPLGSLVAFLREHKYPLDDWQAAISRRGSRRPARKRRAAKTRRRQPRIDLPFEIITLRR